MNNETFSKVNLFILMMKYKQAIDKFFVKKSG